MHSIIHARSPLRCASGPIGQRIDCLYHTSYIHLMSYRVEYFNEAVEAEVMEWPAGILASFIRIAERIVEHGPNLGLPYTRAMGDGLFEIRAKGQEGIGRALFCTVVGKRIVILHGFIKKTEQTPQRALDAARRRMKEIRS